MRIKIIQKPQQSSIDGVRLDYFAAGQIYDVGNSIAAYLLAERWAEPAPEGAQVAEQSFSSSTTPNLIREKYPPYLDDLGLAAHLERRRKKRE